MKKDKLYKALETIALGYSEGNISIDRLEKAVENYKLKTDFTDDYDYQFKVSKSCFDALHGLEQEEDIAKAIVPGQTKVIDGVLYVWSPTKSGSQSEYAWHVVKQHNGKNVGGGSKLSAGKEKDLNALVNDMFPKDLSSLTPVIDPSTGKPYSIGGSTGAQLVEDPKKRAFLKKQSTNKGFIAVEYAANQLYDLVGYKAKVCELYDEGKESVLLSKFDWSLQNISPSDYKDVAQGFMMDVLLANWDIYQNDNVRKDASGNIVRVDNGSCFDYRARGSQSASKFDDDVVQTFNGMASNNRQIYNLLSKQDIQSQIDNIKAHKEDILAFMYENNMLSYAKIMEQRIDNLDDIIKLLNGREDIEDIPIPQRNIVPEDIMYRELDNDLLLELRERVMAQSGDNNVDVILATDKKHGWSLLNEICEERGFAGLPQVVTEDEYWDMYNKRNDPQCQFFRGLENGNVDAEDAAINTLFEDRCYYGTRAAYGQGIYVAQHTSKKNFTTKDGDQSQYGNTWAYQEACSYAGGYGGTKDNHNGIVLKGMFAEDAKIIDYVTISKELNDLTPSGDDKAEALRDELNVLSNNLVDKENEIVNFKQNVKDSVYKQFNFNETEWTVFNDDLDNVIWSKVDPSGNPDIPSWKDMVAGKIAKQAASMGATVRIGRGVVDIKFPYDDETLRINKLQYDGVFALRRRNPMSPMYNGAVETFRDFVNNHYMRYMQQEISKQTKADNPQYQKLIQERDDMQNKYNSKKSELNRVAGKGNPDENFIDSIYAMRGYYETVGLYAALKGYDAIKVNNGYTVVLNRTKLIFSNKVDYV